MYLGMSEILIWIMDQKWTFRGPLTYTLVEGGFPSILKDSIDFNMDGRGYGSSGSLDNSSQIQYYSGAFIPSMGFSFKSSYYVCTLPMTEPCGLASSNGWVATRGAWKPTTTSDILWFGLGELTTQLTDLKYSVLDVYQCGSTSAGVRTHCSNILPIVTVQLESLSFATSGTGTSDDPWGLSAN